MTQKEFEEQGWTVIKLDSPFPADQAGKAIVTFPVADKPLTQREIELIEALADMWNQYCPEGIGHACMSAGENAETILDKYDLLDKSKPYGGVIDFKKLDELLNS